MRITFAMSNRLVGAEAADWLEMRGCLTELSDDSCLLTCPRPRRFIVPTHRLTVGPRAGLLSIDDCPQVREVEGPLDPCVPRDDLGTASPWRSSLQRAVHNRSLEQHRINRDAAEAFGVDHEQILGEDRDVGELPDLERAHSIAEA